MQPDVRYPEGSFSYDLCLTLFTASHITLNLISPQFVEMSPLVTAGLEVKRGGSVAPVVDLCFQAQVLVLVQSLSLKSSVNYKFHQHDL